MKKFILSLFFVVQLFASSEQMLDVVESIRISMDQCYAMKEYKKEKFGWDSRELAAEIKEEILRNPDMSSHEFKLLLNRFFLAAKDYHVGVGYCAFGSSKLPFSLIEFDGCYYVSSVEEGEDLMVGDQVLSMDGTPIQEIVRYFKENFTPGQDNEADRIRAAKFAVSREAKKGMNLPSGLCEIGLIPKEGIGRHIVEVEWLYTEEKMPECRTGYSINPCESNKKSYLPSLGSIIWQAPEDWAYEAKIYENNGLRIGFIHLADYDSCHDAMADFKKIMDMFSVGTDCLVFDQLNNNGGDADLLCGILSCLTLEPISPPKEKLFLNPNIVYETVERKELLEDDEKYQVEKERDKRIYGLDFSEERRKEEIDYCNWVLAEWQQGKTLTDPAPFRGWSEIVPAKEGHYDKPILLLINGNCFSCGDIFPAVMQDTGRALLMGTTTAGAGGRGMKHSFPNQCGIEGFGYTGSIVLRMNGEIIENNGVCPDILYSPTLKDFQSGYRHQADEILRVLHSLCM